MVLALPNVRSSEHPTKLEAESQNLMLIAKAASAMKTTKKNLNTTCYIGVEPKLRSG